MLSVGDLTGLQERDVDGRQQAIRAPGNRASSVLM